MLNLDNIKSFIFSAGEVHVELSKTNINDLVASNFKLYAIVDTPEKQLKLIMTLSAINNMFDSEIELVLPYLPYSRQDRVCSEGQAFSLEAFLKILSSFNINLIHTTDVHSDKAKIIAARFDIVLVNGFTVKRLPNINDYDFLIAPDSGAVNRVQALSGGVKPIICCTKERDPKTGHTTKYNTPELPPGNTALVIDDICDGGKTFEILAESIPEITLDLFVTFGIFSKGLENLNTKYRNIFYGYKIGNHF